MTKRANHGFVLWPLLGLLAAFFLYLNWYESKPHAPPQALQPGDVNYPVVNPAPLQVVNVTAIIPDGWPAEFHLLYMVEVEQQSNPNKFLSPAGCAWKQDKQFLVDAPLTLNKTRSNVYEGKFAIDYFLPGACQWSMYDINSPILRSALSFRRHSAHSSAHPSPDIDLTEETQHIWCTKHGMGAKKSSDLRDKYDCVPFEMVEIFTFLPAGFKESVPKDQQSWSLIFTQYLRHMTVEIHDLDQLIPEYVNRSSANFMKSRS